MEIIMKVKCSPSPGAASSPHSTLKVVDHHNQLQQHTFTNASYKTSPPPNNVQPPRSYTPNTHQSSVKYPINSNNTSCSDCSVGYCCNISSCCVATPSSHYSQTLPQSTFSSSSAAPPYPHAEPCTNNSPIYAVDEPEFVSIDDEKVKQYLIRLGQQQLEKQQQQQQQMHQQFRTQREPKITHVFSAPTSESTVKPVVYEIIELDDEDEREKLKQIKQQAERSFASKKLPPNLSINFAHRHTKSLDISLIPKTPENATIKSNQEFSPINSRQTSSRELNKNSSNHKIIAEIDLVESDEDDAYMKDDDDDDDDTLPLAAVSCELQCDDEEEICNNSTRYSTNLPYNTNYTQQRCAAIKYSKPLVDDVVIIGSQEHKNSDDMLVRWEEYEGHRERVFFECFLCGKKVQSSYNLRRHMMIHTGYFKTTERSRSRCLSSPTSSRNSPRSSSFSEDCEDNVDDLIFCPDSSETSSTVNTISDDVAGPSTSKSAVHLTAYSQCEAANTTNYLLNISSPLNNNDRKRAKQSEKWKHNVIKKKRNTGEEYESNTVDKKIRPQRQIRSTCAETCRLKCYNNFDENERKQLFASYWKLGDVQMQRYFIANCMKIVEPTYRYVRVGGPRCPRKHNNAFFFKKGDNVVRVCKQFFKNTLDINDRPIRTVLEKREKFNNQLLEPDLRGKHGKQKKIDPQVKAGVKEFIDKIPKIATHYTATNTTKFFIEGDNKTITSIYKDYVEVCKVKKEAFCTYISFYRTFTEDFNISLLVSRKDLDLDMHKEVKQERST